LERSMLTATNLHKSYRRHKVVVPVLRGLDLEVRPGEFLSVIGASGSGKSTLLHLLGTLDRPDDGEIHLDGRRIDDLPGPERDALRNRTFGFIFQFYHLLPELSALENVLIPAMIDQSVLGWLGRRRELRRRGAAIARALIARPRVLLADEPTGNLDEATGGEIIKLLRSLNREEGLTIAMVTHNLELVTATDRVVRITTGRVEASPPSPGPAVGLYSEAC
jgi:lipoprotein-releasing system ATP-binding protein